MVSLIPIVAASGDLIDQRVAAVQIAGQVVSLMLEARGKSRNTGYAIALARILEIASQESATLLIASVDSSVAIKKLPNRETRRIDLGKSFRYPLRLEGLDIDSLRLQLTNNQRQIASSVTRTGGGAWKKASLDLKFESSSSLERFLAGLSSPVISSIPVPAMSAAGLTLEGALTTIRVNKYERSPASRLVCIDHHGVECAVCDFSFEAAYGSLGAGFIHVHHLMPVSQLGGGYL